jgi:VCBS repeat-containing protein
VRATDSSGLAVSTSFLLNVTAVNDAPTTVADTYTVPQFGTLVANDANGSNNNAGDNGVLANDSDLEGNPLTAVIVVQPQFGTVTLNPNGTFTYKHTGSTRAADSFTYRANDGQLNSVETTVTINVGAPIPPPHQNPINAADVNADGFVSAIDALLVINLLNSLTSGNKPVSELPAPPPYRDVNGDNFISPVDALLVINYLNTHRGTGEGEGEGASVVIAAPASGTAANAAAAWSYSVSRPADNEPVGVRAIPLLQNEVYGPLEAQQFGLVEVLDELAGEGESQGLVLGQWASGGSAEEQHRASDEALTDLLSEFSL